MSAPPHRVTRDEHGPRGGLGQRLHDAERAALSRRARHIDLGAVRSADRLDDGQTEPRPTLRARTRVIHAEESLEHVRQRLSWNADAVVHDLENGAGGIA